MPISDIFDLPSQRNRERLREQRDEFEERREKEYRRRGLEVGRDRSGRVFPKGELEPDERGLVDLERRREVDREVMTRPESPEFRRERWNEQADEQLKELRAERNRINRLIGLQDEKAEEIQERYGMQLEEDPDSGELIDQSEFARTKRRLLEQKGEETGFIRGLFPGRDQGDPTPKAIDARERLEKVDPEIKEYRLARERLDRIMRERNRAREKVSEIEARQLELKRHREGVAEEGSRPSSPAARHTEALGLGPGRSFDEPGRRPESEPEPTSRLLRPGERPPPTPEGYHRYAEGFGSREFVHDIPESEAEERIAAYDEQRRREGRADPRERREEPAAPEPDPEDPRDDPVAPDRVEDTGPSEEKERPALREEVTKAAESDDPGEVVHSMERQREIESERRQRVAAGEEEPPQVRLRSAENPGNPPEREDERTFVEYDGEQVAFIGDDGSVRLNARVDPRVALQALVDAGAINEEDAAKVLKEGGYSEDDTGKDALIDRWEAKGPQVRSRIRNEQDFYRARRDEPARRRGALTEQSVMRQRRMEGEARRATPGVTKWHPEYVDAFNRQRAEILRELREERGDLSQEGFVEKFRQAGWDMSFGTAIDQLARGIIKWEDLEVDWERGKDMDPEEIRRKAEAAAYYSLTNEIFGASPAEREKAEGFAEHAGQIAGSIAGITVNPGFRAGMTGLRAGRLGAGLPRGVASGFEDVATAVGRGAARGAEAGAVFTLTNPPKTFLPEDGQFASEWVEQAAMDVAGFAGIGGAIGGFTRALRPAFYRRIEMSQEEFARRFPEIGQKVTAMRDMMAKGGPRGTKSRVERTQDGGIKVTRQEPGREITTRLTAEEARIWDRTLEEVVNRVRRGDSAFFDTKAEVLRPREWTQQVPFIRDLVQAQARLHTQSRPELQAGRESLPGRPGEAPPSRPEVPGRRPITEQQPARTEPRPPAREPTPEPQPQARPPRQPEADQPATPPAEAPARRPVPEAIEGVPEDTAVNVARNIAAGRPENIVQAVQRGELTVEQATRMIDRARELGRIPLETATEYSRIVQGESARPATETPAEPTAPPQTAKFIGFQEGPKGEQVPIYNVSRWDEQEGRTVEDTVSAEDLQARGIEVPETPEPPSPEKTSTDVDPSSTSVDSPEPGSVISPEHSPEESRIVESVRDRLAGGEAVTRKNLRELARDTELTPKQVDEMAELGVVQAARQIATGEGTPEEKFDRLVQLYQNQPNLTAKTSTSKIQQAYSTPAPAAFLMSELADIAGAQIRVRDDAGGNAMLVSKVDPNLVAINEIDPVRAKNLRAQGFAQVTQEDALRLDAPEADRMIMNPPFGAVKQDDGSTRRFEITTPDGRTLETTAIDHAIVLSSLRGLTDDGQAAFMIGGHKGDRDSRAKKYNTRQNREFFYFLYENYNVTDHFTLDGDLYSKQGAGWPVDIIIIDGKGKSRLPLPAVEPPRVLTHWDDARSKLTEARGEDATEAAPRTRGPREPRGGTPGGRESRTPTDTRPGRTESDRVSREPETARGERSGEVSRRDRPEQPSDRRDAGVVPETTETPRSGVEGERHGPVPEPRGERRRPVEREQQGDFQVTYQPSSRGAGSNTITPNNLADPQRKALENISERVGDVDQYVREKLGYQSEDEFRKAFFAEQVDALALAIESIENGRGFIVGDQTGVGKGRVAAGLIRYAIRQGLNPVFVTAKKGLYNDMLRDLAGIGNKDDIVPHITDNNLSFTDQFGRKWRTPKQTETHRKIAADGVLPEGKNAVFTTYSQIGSDVAEGFKEDKKARAKRQRAGHPKPDGDRMEMLRAIAPRSVFILDESHKGAGSGSEVNMRMLDLLQSARGAYYSSATYAKNPDAIPLYFKTTISDSGIEPKSLAEVMNKGGVPLQQFVSNMLAQDGQYIRRERSFENVQFHEKIALENEGRDKELADRYTDFMSQLVFFWRGVDRIAKEMDQQAKKQAEKITGSKADGGVDSMNFGSSLFQFTQQYLFSLKADSIANEAIAKIREGKKVVIAVQNTNEGPMEDILGMGGDLTFNGMLLKNLENILWVKRKVPGGETVRERIDPEQMDDGGQTYNELVEAIQEADFGGMPLSPIDYIRNKVEDAGIRTGEITGRKRGINKNGEVYQRPISETRTAGQINTVEKFNNEDIDAVVLNASGSTGISLHAAEEYKDHRQRVMIVGQPQLDINEFMQTLGRVHRAGQVVDPEYVLLMTSLPAERRLSAMTRRKMSMLNANTTSNADTDITKDTEATDIFNQYGDEVLYNIIKENPSVVELMPTLFPQGMDSVEEVYNNAESPGEFARRATGHLVLTPIADQEFVWNRAAQDYNALIDYLNEMGDNELVVHPRDYQAETLEIRPVFAAGDGTSAFSGTANLERVKTTATKKPLELGEIRRKVSENGDSVKQNFQRFRESMQAAMESEIETRKSRAKEWNQDKEAKIRASYNTAFSEVSTIRNLMGKPVSVGSKEDVRVLGIVTDIRFDFDHPRALSRQQAEIHVNTSQQRVLVPISKASDIKPYEGMQGSFEQDWEATKETSAERLIVTGNLLAGYKYLKDRGQGGKMISYTTQDGEVVQGIQLPAGTKLAEWRRVNNADELFEAINANQKVSSAEGVEFVLNGRGDIEIRVPSSKVRGGKFWQNQALNRLVQGGEFREIAGMMRATIDRSNLPDVFNLLTTTLRQELGYVPKDSFSDKPQESVGAPDFGLRNPKDPRRDTERIPIAPIEGATAKPIDKILLNFKKATGAPLRRGKVSKRRGGEYFPGSARTVIRFEGDFDKAAHEIAHFLDDRYGIVADWVDRDVSPFDQELAKFWVHGSVTRRGQRSKPAYKRAEGVAEWIRAYIMNPEEAIQAAPEFYAHFEQTVPEEAKQAIHQFSDEVRAWAGSDPMGRTLSNVDTSIHPPSAMDKVKDRVSNMVEDLPAELVDSLQPIWKMVGQISELSGVSHILPSKHPVVQILNQAGFNRKAMDVMNHGPITARNQTVPGFDKGFATLFRHADHSSKEAFGRDVADTIGLMVNERILERANLIDQKIADTARNAEKHRLDNLYRNNDISAEELQRRKDELDESETLDEMYERGLLPDDVWEKRIEALRQQAFQQKSRIAGTGAGIYADHEQAAAALEQLQSDPKRLERLRKGAELYRRWATHLLEYARDKGRISEKDYSRIVESNQFYVAFNRIMDQIQPELPGVANRALGRTSRILYKFKGSTRRIKNPYISLALQTYSMMREADRNEALRTLRDLMVRPRGMHEGRQINFAQFGSRAKAGDPNTIKIWVEGKPEYWQFENKKVFEALKGWAEPGVDGVFARFAQVFPRILHEAIVHSPGFVVRSTIKDMLHKAVVSKVGTGPFDNLHWLGPGGIKEYRKMLREFNRFGGGLFGHHMKGEQDYYREMARIMKREISSSRVRHVFTSPKMLARGWHEFVAGAEIMGRVTEFRNAKQYAIDKLGLDEFEASHLAAFLARDITDYARAGSVIRNMNRYFIFTSAAIRGNVRDIEGMRGKEILGVSGIPPVVPPPPGTQKTGGLFPEPDKGTAQKILGRSWPAVRLFAKLFYYLGGISAAAYLWNKSMGADEEYRQLPAYIRDFFWTFYVPVGGGFWIDIPKPWQIGAWSSAIDRSMHAAETGDSTEFDDYLGSLRRITMPIDESAIAGPAQGLVEVATGKDLFRDRRIILPWEEDLDIDLRSGTERASRAGQLVQEAIGIDARNIDHLLRSQLAEPGQVMLDISDIGREDRRGMTGARLARRFTGIGRESPAWNARDVQWVFDYARRRDRRGDPEVQRLRELLNRYSDSETRQEANDAARAAREHATRVRKRWEAGGSAAPSRFNPFDLD